MSKNAAVGGFVVVVLVGLAWVGWQFLSGGPDVGPDRSGDSARAEQSDQEDTPDQATSQSPDLAASRDQLESAGGTDLATGGPRAALATAAFLTGQVTDEQGVPVVGASVSFGTNVRPEFALLGLRIDSAPERKVTGTTDGSGRFRLNTVPRGEGAALRVEHPDHQPLSRGNLHPPSTGLDLGQLQMAKGATLTGRVVGPRGEPVVAAEVVFQPDMQAVMERNILSPFGRSGGGSPQQTETAEDGTFRLQGLADLPGTVEASKKGLDRASSELLEPIVGRETGGIELSLGTGLSIQGVVRDPAGNGVAGAEVSWFGGESGPFTPMRFGFAQADKNTLLTGADGRFVLEGLAKGAYGVTARAGGFASRTIDGIQAGERDPVVLELKPGGEALCRVLNEKTGEPITHARIRAQDQDGGYVQLLQGLGGEDSPTDSPDPGTYLVRELSAATYTLQIEAEGYVSKATESFEVGVGQRADAGVVNLMPAASISGRVVAEQGDAPVEGAKVTARAKHTQNDSQVFRTGNGQVMSLRLSAPVSGGNGGVRLDTMSGDVTGRAVTDAEGRFELEDLVPGDYELLVEHWDHAPRSTDPIVVEAGEQHEGVEVALALGGTLEGISLGATGTPRSGDTITVKCPSVAGVTLRGTSDAQGLYRIEHVPAGEHTARRSGPSLAAHSGPIMVFATNDDSGEKGETFTIKDGETVRVDFMEGEAASMYGDVTSALGAAPGTEVRLHKRQGDAEPQFMFQPLAAAKVDAAGRYEVGPVPAGDYTVEVKHPNALVPIREPVTLLAGAPQRQDFFLEGAVVDGRVFAPGGRPLSGATVRLQKIQEEANQTQATASFATIVMVGRSGGGGRGGSFLQTNIMGDVARTGQDGSYSIEWVPDGRYQVKVTHPDYLDGESSILEIKNHKNARNVDVKLEEGGTLLIEVTMEDTGRPSPGRMVQIQKEGGGGHEMAMSDDQGEVFFSGLEPGTWTLTSSPMGGGDTPKTGPQNVSVFAGQETRASIQY